MASGEEPSFVSFILKPGSSLHPTFLLAVDAAFALLFAVFLWSAYLTKGNPHFFVLMGIELALWGSVKWYVDVGHMDVELLAQCRCIGLYKSLGNFHLQVRRPMQKQVQRKKNSDSCGDIQCNAIECNA